MEKSVIIIGGGIAGLATGCYAQMNGYHTQIFEMGDKPGGLCTAWERKGYTIDGCLHWLLGSAPSSSFHHYWQELGMLLGRQVIDMPQLYRYEALDGRAFTMYCNIDRLEQHMMELAPEDAALIGQLSKTLRHLTKFDFIPDKPPELSGLWDKIKMAARIIPFMGDMRQWGRLTMGGLAAKFKSPLLRESWRFAYDNFSVIGFLISLTWMHKKEAGYTIGGSMPLMRSVEKRYAGLGGRLNYKSKVTRILVENDRAVGVRLENGDEHRADHIISAADGHATIFDMLEGKYIDDTIRSYYTDLPIFTPLIYIGLGVNRSFADLPQVISGITMELDQPVIFGGLEQRKLHVRIHNFDPTLAPPGKSVLTLMIDSDYDYWKKLKAEPAQYKSEKEKIAHAVINILERRFPGLAGQVEMVDVATPVTFERYTGNWQGCYEGWLVTPKTVNMNMKKTLPGLGNFYMAGQWVMPGGGLPGGAMAGRYVTQILCKRDGKKFMVTKP